MPNKQTKLNNNNKKKILSSTSAQVLNNFKENNIRRSKSMINESFKNDQENNSEEEGLMFEFENSYPWIGLEIPEAIDKSLENASLIQISPFLLKNYSC